MKIVIDIPESYLNIQSISVSHFVINKVWDAVKEGTPLPKGHGRLIDADDAISKICGGSCGCHFEECGYDKPCFSVTRIELAPTVIEADKEK